MIRSYDERRFDKLVDFTDGRAPAIRASAFRLRKIHQYNPKMTGILHITGDAFLEIELDRSS